MASYPRKTATKAPGIETAGKPSKRNLSRLTLAADPRGYSPPFVPYQPARPVAPPKGPFSDVVTSITNGYSFKPNAEHR